MTTYLDRSPHQPPRRPTPSRDSAATRDDQPRAAGTVPITVWRLDDHDDGQPATEPGSGFASRLARRLILTYTSLGETVADLDSDPHVHGAASTTGRSYLAITEPPGLSSPDQPRPPASLVTLRWPRPTGPSTVEAGLCRRRLGSGFTGRRPWPPEAPLFGVLDPRHHSVHGLRDAAH
jgi:hypothetical protein